MSQNILLQNQTSNVAAGAAKENSAETSVNWFGGSSQVLAIVSGTFDGATVSLEYAPGSPHSGYIANADLQWTDGDLKVVHLPGEGTVSASVASAGASTDVTMTIEYP